MSGSGGGYGGGGGGEQPSCDTLVIRTSLSSPKPAVVGKLREKEVLKIVQEGATGPVVAKTADGKTAGSITSGQLLRLMQCIDEGYTYVAIVKAIDKGKVDVEVRPGSTK